MRYHRKVDNTAHRSVSRGCLDAPLLIPPSLVECLSKDMRAEHEVPWYHHHGRRDLARSYHAQRFQAMFDIKRGPLAQQPSCDTILRFRSDRGFLSTWRPCYGESRRPLQPGRHQSRLPPVCFLLESRSRYHGPRFQGIPRSTKPPGQASCYRSAQGRSQRSHGHDRTDPGMARAPALMASPAAPPRALPTAVPVLISLSTPRSPPPCQIVLHGWRSGSDHP